MALPAPVAWDTQIPFTNAFASLSIWTLLMVVSNWASLKSIRLRRFLDGEPVPVVSRGGRCDLSDVAYAELEPDGVLYVDRRQDGLQG